jgi:hypothetical protein
MFDHPTPRLSNFNIKVLQKFFPEHVLINLNSDWSHRIFGGGSELLRFHLPAWGTSQMASRKCWIRKGILKALFVDEMIEIIK